MIDYNPLGRSGLLVSRLALGAMTFGEGPGPLQRLDAAAATQLVEESIEAGINLFNTAATYGGGQSEEILGRALGTRRPDVVIATKVAGSTGKAVVHRGLSRRHIIEALDGSLRRLQTDYVDVYLAHHFDSTTPLEETLETFDSIVRQGKARYIGFSNWPAWLAAKAIGMQQRNGWHSFCASESYYSLLGRDVEHELVPFCDDAGIGLLAWSPLAMGLLSGRYTREDMQGQSGRFTTYDVVPPIDLVDAHDVLDVVRDIASSHGATPSQVSLAWLLTKKRVNSVLIGASSLSQLRENIAAANVNLSSDALARLDSLTAPIPIYPAWLRQKMAERERGLKDAP
jgi:aryl-alcohol dehydrogenase-like predicted oxidoreductase